MKDTRRCPICGKPQDIERKPFCSKRCADIDLGRWLKGSYIVPGVRWMKAISRRPPEAKTARAKRLIRLLCSNKAACGYAPCRWTTGTGFLTSPPSRRSAQVAQSVEQRTENPRVGGSIPPLGTSTYT